MVINIGAAYKAEYSLSNFSIHQTVCEKSRKPDYFERSTSVFIGLLRIAAADHRF